MAAQSEYCVTPAQKHRQPRENCSTLEEYAIEGAFNRSNVVWIFKEGKHILNGNIVAFSDVHNVTLTGSKACEQNISKCSIHCEGEQACMFLFVASSNITISNLRFIHQDTLELEPVSVKALAQHLPGVNLCYNHSLGFPSSIAYAYFNNCLHDRSWVFVDVAHITVSNVEFKGRHSYWVVVRPNGSYKVLNCQFYDLFLAQTSQSGDPQHYLTVVLRKPHTNQSTLTFLITNSSFNSRSYLPSKSFKGKGKRKSTRKPKWLEAVMAYPVVHLISDKPLNGWKANITIEYCHFYRCSPFQLTAIEDRGLTITLNAVTAKGNSGNGHSSAQNELQQNQSHILMGSAIRLFLSNCRNTNSEPIQGSTNTPNFELQRATNNSLRPSNITVTSSHFMSFASERGCIVLFKGCIVDGQPKQLRIVLHNNTFMDCYSQKYCNRSVVYAYQYHVYHKSQRNQSDDQEHRLVIDSNRSEENFDNGKMNQSCEVFDRVPKGYLIGTENTYIFNSTCREICIWQGVYLFYGFSHHERVLFTGNTISKNKAQGLTLFGTVLELVGENCIYDNVNYYGGGIAMHGNSQLWIRNGSHLNVSNNRAFVSGGGIFVHDPCMVVQPRECPCFFEFIGSDGRPLRNTSVHTFNASVTLHGNKAATRASMIFNTNSDRCVLKGSLQNSTKLFHQVFGIPKHRTQEDISSIPQSICNCSHSMNNSPKCTNWSQDSIPIYPGQNLTLNVMAIGDMGIPLDSVLYVYLDKREHMEDSKQYVLLPLHSTHVLRNCCNSLIIPPLPSQSSCEIHTVHDVHNWALQLMVPIEPNRNQNVFLSKYLPTRYLPCPQGYRLVNQIRQCHCECYKLLSDKKVQCLLDKQEFVLPKNYWMGTEEFEEYEGSLPTKVLLSANCPKVYCDTANSEMKVSLSKSYTQCKHGRTGVLCGQCPKGESVVYNSYACQTCTDWGVLLLVPLLIAGPLLIALICCLNLTISVGSINGFLFYINIIAINSDVLTISTGDSTHGMRVLGIVPFTGLCFYNGMDEFASTLLTYLFPIYLLTLVGLICLLPKCKCVNMHKINRRIGPRITPVLATVILLSYTQLAESVIRSLLFVRLYVTDGTNTTSKLVWMFDGSLEYFQSTKHVVLGCLALLVLMCFLLPVTVVSIFGDLFRRFSRGPWYMNFLDSFHGAFRFRFGFWIGIRILLRILFIVLKIFLPVDELFLVIAYTIMTLLFLQILIRPFRGIRVDECVSKKIKEKHFPEPLQRELVHSIDHSFLVNLIAVFVYLPHKVQNTTTVLIVSRVIAYVEFVGILVYHMMEYSPVGPFVFDTWFKLQQRYRRWRENRREATLARAMHNADGRGPCEEQFDLVLRASDCTDSEYEGESESSDDNVKETSDHLQGGDMTMTKQASDERCDWSCLVEGSLSSELTTPLVKKIQGNTE